MVKTHKDDNTVRVIISACNTSIENLSMLIEKTCLVTSLMLFTSFLIRTVETSLLVQLMISRLDLESTKATSRLRKIAVVLPDILTTNVVIVTIIKYFSKHCK